MSASELLAAYLDHLRAMRRSPNTIHRVRFAVNGLAKFVVLDTAGADDIEDWLDSKVICARTRANYLALVAGFYRWAVRRGHVEKDPTVMIERPSVPRLLPRPMRNDDLARALAEAPTPRMRLFLCLAAYEGMRAAEIAGLHTTDILATAVPPMVRIAGKGQRERLVPIAADTEAALAAFGIPRYGPMFPSRISGRALLPQSVSKYISDYLRSLDINATAHQGRHWFGTEVYRRTRDLRATQELLGHSSPVTTAGYTKFSPNIETVGIIRGLSVQPRRSP